LWAAAEVFAAKGFAGGATREICERAGTSSNMSHYYFAPKAGPPDAIVEQNGSQGFLSLPMRLLASPTTSVDDLVSRLTLLYETTLEVCLQYRTRQVRLDEATASSSAGQKQSDSR